MSDNYNKNTDKCLNIYCEYIDNATIKAVSLLLIAIVSACPTDCNGQPNVSLIRLYDAGQIQNERFEDVYKLADEGFLLCGSSNYHAWLLKTDDDGGEVWEYLHDNGKFFSVIEADNGDAVVGGSFNGGFSAMRLNSNGEIVWQRYYIGGTCSAVIELKSGEFVLAGYTGTQGYIAMIDDDGEPIWNGLYGEAYLRPGIYTMRETMGGIVTAGRAEGDRGWAQKVDFEGRVIWTQYYEDELSAGFQSIVSTPDSGFAICGTSVPFNNRGSMFSLTFINNEGEALDQYYYPLAQFNSDFVFGMTKLQDRGFIIVGRNIDTNDRPVSYYPLIIRTNQEGEEVWHSRLEAYIENIDARSLKDLTSVIALPDDRVAICGQMRHEDLFNRGMDGLFVIMESARLGPFFIEIIPEDTILTTLVNTSINFEVRAQEHEGVELVYQWIFNDTELGDESSETIEFNSLGEHTVSCRVSDQDATIPITWHVTVTDLYISAFSPDTLNLSLRRGESVNFSLDTVRAVDGIEDVEYLWLKSRVDGMDEVDSAGTDSRATVSFMQSGNYAVEGLAYRGESSDAVVWNLQVRGVVWSFAPEDVTLEVLPDSLIRFEVIPSNPEDSSLSTRWFVDDDLAAQDTTALELLFSYPVHSVHLVHLVLSDSIESDTVSWTVTVRDLGVKDKRDAYPTRSALLSVSPNPFNSTLTIRYSSPINREATSISIHDISGREVFSAVTAPSVTEENSRAVKHGGMTAKRTLIWDASNIPAGVYFVRLQSGAEFTTKKVVLMR